MTIADFYDIKTDGNEVVVTQPDLGDPEADKKVLMKDIQDDSEIDKSVWSQESDLKSLKAIKERAMMKDTLEDHFEKTRDRAYGLEDRRKLAPITKGGKRGVLPEEAVLKIVANIDSTYISAECMKLTQVGFIDVLRKVNREKFQTLKQVKDHFTEKVQKVVQAKEYQIRCQKIIAIDAAKKIVSETTKDSSELFNHEVTALMH